MIDGRGNRAPSAGIEPAHTGPEPDALSPELRGQGTVIVARRPSGTRFGADRSRSSSLQRCSPPSPRFRADDGHQGRPRHGRGRRPAGARTSIRPIRYRSSGRPTPITATGPPRWPWPSPRRPDAIPASWANSWSTRSARRPPAHVAAVEIAGPGFVNFRLADSWLHDVLGQLIDEGVDGYRGPRSGSGHPRQHRVRQRQPHRPAPHRQRPVGLVRRRPVAAVQPVRVPGRPGVLPQRPRRADAAVRRLAGGPQGRRGAARGRVPGGVRRASGPPRCPTMPTRSSGATRRSRTTWPARSPRWVSSSSAGSASARWWTAAPSRPRSTDLRAHGVVYEADGAVWLRSTDFGDDKDRVLVRSDGEYTYVLPDIAYHRDKFARGYELLIDVWGADHHGYVSRLRAGMQALGHQPDEFEIILGQLVTLKRGGDEVRIGKRSGTAIWLDELLGRGRRRLRPPHLPAPVDGQPPDVRHRRGDQHRQREPRLLRAVRQRPDPLDRAQGGRAWHHPRPAGRGRSLGALASAGAGDPPGALRAAGAGRGGLQPSVRPTGSPPGPASWRRRSTASTTTATCCPRTSPSPPGRPGSGWSRRRSSASRSPPTCWA